MSRQNQQAFTIIELMLFVAISGLLTVSLLGGWTVAINTQSYKDSVRSLAGELQSQYSNTFNVSNDRGRNYTCSGGITETDISDEASNGPSRGASDCVLLGRYVSIDGETVTSDPIIGKKPSGVPSSTASDIDIIKSYNPTRKSDKNISSSTFKIPWSSKPYLSDQPDSDHLNIVIVRSPTTGTAYTFTRTITGGGGDASIVSMLSATAQTAKTICLNPDAVIAQGRLGVKIAANAATASAVTVAGDGESNGC